MAIYTVTREKNAAIGRHVGGIKTNIQIALDFSGSMSAEEQNQRRGYDTCTARVAADPELRDDVYINGVIMSGFVMSSGPHPAANAVLPPLIAGGGSPHCELFRKLTIDGEVFLRENPDAVTVDVIAVDGDHNETAKEMNAEIEAYRAYQAKYKVHCFVVGVTRARLNTDVLKRISVSHEMVHMADIDWPELFDMIFALLKAGKKDPKAFESTKSLKREEIAKAMGDLGHTVPKFESMSRDEIGERMASNSGL